MINQLSEIGLQPAPAERFLFHCGLWIATGRHLTEPNPLVQLMNLEQGDKVLMSAAFRERMVPMVSEFSRMHELDVDTDFHTISRVIGVGMKALYKHIAPVVQALTDAGVAVMILKGADLALTTYPPHVPRMMHDIDLLIKPVDADKTRAIFRDHGFVQGDFDRNRLEIVPYNDKQKESLEADHYELAPFRKLLRLPSLDAYAATIDKYVPVFFALSVSQQQVFFAVKCDIHLYISRKMAPDDLWYKPRHIQLPSGLSTFAQSPADLLWFLASRVYYETMATGTVRLIQFIDVLSVAKTFRGEIDWERIQYIAGRYNLHASLFYVFSRVNDFLDEAVPCEVIDFCNPARAGVPQHKNLGDFTSSLFRITPRPDPKLAVRTRD